MTYTIAKRDTAHHDRAYVLRGIRSAAGEPVAVLITPAGPITRARRIAMQRIALQAAGKDAAASHASDDELDTGYARTPWCRWDSLTIAHQTVTNDDDAADIRMSWDYSHSLGMGELPFNTVMATV